MVLAIPDRWGEYHLLCQCPTHTLHPESAMRYAPFCVVLLAFCSPLTVAADDKPKEMTTRQLVAKTKDAIVMVWYITTIERDKLDTAGKVEKDAKGVAIRESVQRTTRGTGFIVADGFIVTNNHVVVRYEPKPGEVVKESPYYGTFAFDTRDPKDFPPPKRVPFELDPKYLPPSPHELVRNVVPLKVVGRDKLSDLAVMRVALPEESQLGERPIGRGASIRRHLADAALAFAPTGDTEVGDDVVAIGFPASLEGMPTVTKGILSATGRSMESGQFTDLLQTDAAINPGNSGGPLLDIRGRVVGVNTYSLNHLGAPGIGFARSARTAAPFVQLLQKPEGIKRSPLGFTPFVVSAKDQDLLGLAPGLFVLDVDKGGRAEKAGLRVGDIVVQIDEEKVSRAGDMNNALAFASGKESVTVTIWRLAEPDLKAILEGKAGIDRLAFVHLAFPRVQPDGAIKLDTIEKLNLTVKLK